MNRSRAWLSLGGLICVLSACASNRNLVVVLPETNGHVGAVVVQAGGSKTVLDRAYSADLPRSSGHRLATLSPKAVDRVFGQTLAALPRPPVDFTFRFATASSELDADALAQVDEVIAEINRRQVAEIVITGHTDTVGDDATNEALSKARAEAVKASLSATLAAHGVPADNVVTAGRGKREPLPGHERDNTDDPLNRRVVITVR